MPEYVLKEVLKQGFTKRKNIFLFHILLIIFLTSFVLSVP